VAAPRGAPGLEGCALEIWGWGERGGGGWWQVNENLWRHPAVSIVLQLCCKCTTLLWHGGGLPSQPRHTAWPSCPAPQGGDLYTALRHHSETMRWERLGRKVALDVALGLNYLHSQVGGGRDGGRGLEEGASGRRPGLEPRAGRSNAAGHASALGDPSAADLAGRRRLLRRCHQGATRAPRHPTDRAAAPLPRARSGRR
jgi:hypothetical protein